MPLSFFQGGDGDVQGIFGVYDPHAVGTQEADTISFRDLPETFLQLPPFLSGLLETGADDDRALCAYFCEILEERDDLGRGDDQHCQVRRFWEVKRGGVGSASQDGLFRRMDGVEFPPPAVREDGESLHVSHLHGVVARSGDRDGARVQQQVERIVRHASFPHFYRTRVLKIRSLRAQDIIHASGIRFSSNAGFSESLSAGEGSGTIGKGPLPVKKKREIIDGFEAASTRSTTTPGTGSGSSRWKRR